MSKSFTSKRKFRVWIYTPSHKTLIIRSEKQYHDVDYYVAKYDDPEITIDLEFTGVNFISVPEYFNEITIKKIGDKFIFNDNENWFVEAFSCVVGKSNWNYNQDVFSGLKYNDSIVIK
ncbi:hypothetical protein HYN48_13155 [Flavobacterium magnum]|uniref:YopX protein domain-containing protein n=1 Tax=Flavobacterium magnum TaxID=2162713 RepID=A0A2S0RG94_9FLAO|nr:hypothetical protein [Flavobacterium magnum]AWA30947.1 hypothetical protein HYN48_13155 [Flavobacterium magnum]